MANLAYISATPVPTEKARKLEAKEIFPTVFLPNFYTRLIFSVKRGVIVAKSTVSTSRIVKECNSRDYGTGAWAH